MKKNNDTVANKIHRIIIILIVASLVGQTNRVFAYFDKYPPHSFKDGAYPHLETKAIVGGPVGSPQAYNEDGVSISLRGTPDGLEFYVKDAGLTLIDKGINWRLPDPYVVYRADLDGNGLKDIIVISSYHRVGLGSNDEKVEILLKKNDGNYQKITFDSMAPDLEDFMDLDNDGKYEIMITDMYSSESSGKYHNYFAYNLYQFQDYRLVNVDDKFSQFPRYIWFTDNPNDKNTTHLTRQEKKKHSKEKSSSILYSPVP